jgi:flagellar basal-body rod protein FlgB
MTTSDLALFNGIYTKLDYLGQSQKTIAQNIANADTPDYHAREVQEPNFKRILGETTSRLPLKKGHVREPGLSLTNENHMDSNGLTAGVAGSSDQRETSQRDTYEVSPSNNAVIIEEQLIKAGEVVADHRLMTNVHEKYLNMMRAATGNNR